MQNKKTSRKHGDVHNYSCYNSFCALYVRLYIWALLHGRLFQHFSGSYEVLFYDGIKKIVQDINIRPMPPDQKVVSKSNFALFFNLGSYIVTYFSEGTKSKENHRKKINL